MLQQWVRSPSTPQALTLRSRIVLAASRGHSNQQIAAALRIPEVTAGKWRRAFAASGLDGLQDAPRSGRPPKHGAAVWQRIQTRACQQPAACSRWSVRTLAGDLGLPRRPFTTCWWRRAFSLTAYAPSRLVRTPSLKQNWLAIVGLYPSPTTRWCCVSMKKRGSRRWTARNPGCRWRATVPAPGPMICAARDPSVAGRVGHRDRPRHWTRQKPTHLGDLSSAS